MMYSNLGLSFCWTLPLSTEHHFCSNNISGDYPYKANRPVHAEVPCVREAMGKGLGQGVEVCQHTDLFMQRSLVSERLWVKALGKELRSASTLT